MGIEYSSGGAWLFWKENKERKKYAWKNIFETCETGDNGQIWRRMFNELSRFEKSRTIDRSIDRWNGVETDWPIISFINVHNQEIIPNSALLIIVARVISFRSYNLVVTFTNWNYIFGSFCVRVWNLISWKNNFLFARENFGAKRWKRVNNI